jgi:aspartyl-tRNA(Asn)/glutamyl-tRNA(Gln) amidotransferase subunit A
MPLLADLAADLKAGRITAEALTHTCLDRISDSPTAFTRLYREAALAAAARSDLERARGIDSGPLAGLPVSIKDLFDVAGETTLAGSKALEGEPPAAQDATVVARLKAAGAIIIGRTNMTEFAYSGLGLNPHFGTPVNPLDPARVPGGSSSGAGVAAALGLGAIAIGTDTGGSVRIPATFSGVTGFKPTQARIPRDGTYPLSPSLDSVGPLGQSVACCALVDAVLAGEAPAPLPDLPLRGRRFLVPTGSVLTQRLDAEVAASFEAVLSLLADQGAEIVEREVPELGLVAEIYRLGGIAAPEALAQHRVLLARRGHAYDPLVRQRLEAAGTILAADYIEALAARRAAIRAMDGATREYDALLCPTVPVLPPRIDALTTAEIYFATNSLVLRNTAVFNLLDRPALTLPCHRPGELPVGFMLVGAIGGDRQLLAVGWAVERALADRTGLPRQ